MLKLFMSFTQEDEKKLQSFQLNILNKSYAKKVFVDKEDIDHPNENQAQNDESN